MQFLKWLIGLLTRRKGGTDESHRSAVPRDLVALVKHYEAFEADAYWDKTGRVWTIGYGSTYYADGRRVREGDTITHSAAEALLEKVLADCIRDIRTRLAASLPEPQMIALASFLYNLGPGASGIKDGLFVLRNGAPSTLWRSVNAGDHKTAAEQFGRWVYSGGILLKGLQRRRRAEKYVYEGMPAQKAITQALKDFP